MIHQRQCLPLLFKSREHLSRVHTGLDQLEGDFAFDRLGLLGDPNFAHATLSNFIDERVPARDDRFKFGD
jgi:hypothetical protein